MGSSVLLPSETNNSSKINNRQDAWLFIDRAKNEPIKLRLNLAHEDGADFEYHGYEQILIDGSSNDMVESYYHWSNALPPLCTILNLVMEDFTGPDSCSDQNIVDEFEAVVEEEIHSMGLDENEADLTLELLLDLLRDMYNYLTYSLVHFSLIDDYKIWEFLTCKEARMTDGKLYMTVQIYVDSLRDLDFMEERTDVDFVEVVDGLQQIFITSESKRRDREIYRRSRERGLASRLLG